MTLKKPLIIATLGAAVALAGLSTKAQAADPLIGALIGGGIGAAIGDSTHHRNGAAVGGVIGALVGSSIAHDSNRYYYDDRYAYGGDRYYYEPRRYYAPAPVYGYAPAYPVYGGATIVYSSGSRHRHWDGPRRHYRDHRYYR
jgi:hypothetical protein